MKIRRSRLLAVLAVVAFIWLPRMVAQQSVTVETLNQLVAAFNAHNLDAVMNFFTCVSVFSAAPVATCVVTTACSLSRIERLREETTS